MPKSSANATRRVRADGSKSTGANEIESSPAEWRWRSSAIVAIRSVLETSASVVEPGGMPGPATKKGTLMPPCQTVAFVQPSKVASGPHGLTDSACIVPLSVSRKT